MTLPANDGGPCGCGNCRLCAIAAVANGAKWSDPFGTGRAAPDPKPIVRKLPPATVPGLFDEPNATEG